MTSSACSKIDPAQPIEFEHGIPAHIVAVVHATGKISFPLQGTSSHGEVYAELYEQGVRYLVHSNPSVTKGRCVNAHGRPVQPYDSEHWASRFPVRNVDLAIDLAPMETMQDWGLFA